MSSHKTLCSLERSKSAGQSANEFWPLNELFSTHNVSIHKHHSAVCGFRSTFVPHQSSLTTSQSLGETRNLTLVLCNLSTFHLHMIGIISAQRAVSISTMIHWHYCERNSPATVLAKSRKPLQEVCHYPHTVGKSISTSERKTTQTSRLKCFRGNSADVTGIYK